MEPMNSACPFSFNLSLSHTLSVAIDDCTYKRTHWALELKLGHTPNPIKMETKEKIGMKLLLGCGNGGIRFDAIIDRIMQKGWIHSFYFFHFQPTIEISYFLDWFSALII